jgi:prophage regulatory protein
MKTLEMFPRLLRENEVRHLTGLSRTQRTRLEREGQFPKRVPLSERAFRWVETEIHSWIGGRISARNVTKPRFVESSR